MLCSREANLGRYLHPRTEICYRGRNVAYHSLTFHHSHGSLPSIGTANSPVTAPWTSVGVLPTLGDGMISFLAPLSNGWY